MELKERRAFAEEYFENMDKLYAMRKSGIKGYRQSVEWNRLVDRQQEILKIRNLNK